MCGTKQLSVRLRLPVQNGYWRQIAFRSFLKVAVDGIAGVKGARAPRSSLLPEMIDHRRDPVLVGCGHEIWKAPMELGVRHDVVGTVLIAHLVDIADHRFEERETT